MRKFFIILLVLPFFLSGQIGGRLDYEALNLTTNPRSAALAGTTISLADGDISQFFTNPAVLDSTEAGDVFVHINPYFTDAASYTFSYGFNIKNLESFAVGLNYINLGSFEKTNETGQVLGSFSAADYVISIGKAHKLGPFVLGTNLKFVNSLIDTYSSSALAFDLGGIFHVNKNWTIAMVFENMGFQLVNDSELNPAELPFNVVLGTSFKPDYMPLRFTLTSVNLVNKNLSLDEQTSGRSTGAVDDVLKRINIGTELLLSEHVHLLFGYNHKRKQELRLETLGGGAGFSYGLMIKVKKIQLRFSRATYHAAGGSSFISLQTNLKDFKKIL